jgi:hypothetical protein
VVVSFKTGPRTLLLLYLSFCFVFFMCCACTMVLNLDSLFLQHVLLQLSGFICGLVRLYFFLVTCDIKISQFFLFHMLI